MNPGTSQADESLAAGGLYENCIAEFGPAMERLASAYEADLDLRLDLLQEIHVALWRSFRVFTGRCSLRTWAFRVAHNTAASHVARALRRGGAREWVSLDGLESLPLREDAEARAGESLAMQRLMALIQKLRPVDKQVMLLYLEGLDAAAIGEITGLVVGTVAAKTHRSKEVLARQFNARGGGRQNGSR